MGPNLLTFRFPWRSDWARPRKAISRAAAVIKIELAGLVDDGVRVDGGTEIEPAGGQAADDAGLGRQSDIIQNFFFVGHTRDALGHADPQVDHAVGLELEGGPPGDDFSFAHLHGRDRLHGHADFSAVGRVVGFREGLVVIFGPGDHDAVDKNAGDFNLAGVQGPAVGDAFHLDDDESAGVSGGGGDGQGLQGQGLPFHGDISVRVRRGPPEDGHMDGQGLVGEIFLTVEGDELHQVLGGAGVDFAAAVSGVHEGAEADRGEGPGFFGRDIPVHVGDHALGKVVGLYAVVHRQLLELGHQAPVPADHAADKALMPQVVQPALLAVALAGGVDQGQIAGALVADKIVFDGNGDLLREADAHKTARGDGVAVADHLDGLFRRHDLSFLHPGRRKRGKHGMPAVRQMSCHVNPPIMSLDRKMLWVNKIKSGPCQKEKSRGPRAMIRPRSSTTMASDGRRPPC